jgi:hypothetical protein
MQPSEREAIIRLAGGLRRRGLATPTLLLVETLAPVGQIAGDVVKAVRPLLPSPQWHATATTLAESLADPSRRDLLLQLLEN